MTLSPAELAARRPVRGALSAPYLDTDVSLSLKWRVTRGAVIAALAGPGAPGA